MRVIFSQNHWLKRATWERKRERERGHAWIKSIRWNAFTTIIILDLSVKMSLDLIIYWTKVWKCILKLKMDNLVIITIIFIFTLFLLIFSINFLLFSFTFSNEKSGYPLSLSLSLSLSCNYTLCWWIIVIFKSLFWFIYFGAGFFSSLSQVLSLSLPLSLSLSLSYLCFDYYFFFFELILSYFESKNLNLYQNTILVMLITDLHQVHFGQVWYTLVYSVHFSPIRST